MKAKIPLILFQALILPLVFAAGSSGRARPTPGTGEDMDIVVPTALQKGDLVGIVMPAGRAAPERLQLAVDYLIDKGFRVVFSGDIYLETEYGVGDGSEKARAEAFNKLARDPEIKAIFCLRGGYGSMHLLRNIDYEALRRNRPIIVGYSDITALHAAIFKKAGLVTFHGPMLSSNHGQEESFDLLFDLLMKPAPGFPVKNLDGTAFSVINEGPAEGLILGGNLTLISTLMGTEYEFDLKDKILFIEDLDEAPYRLHRYMWQLKLAGKLDEAAAVLIGDILPDEEYDDPEISLKVVLEALKEVGAPILYNVRAGHAENPLTIPMGARVRIDGREVRVMEEVVAPAAEKEDGLIKTALMERFLRAPGAGMPAEEFKALGLSEVELGEGGVVTATLAANIEADLPVLGFVARGAGDKAGMAIILTAMEHLAKNPQIPRGKIRLALIPDEEIGPEVFEAFGADLAFTVDGGALGELTFENFNAARALVEITGRAPGSAEAANAALLATELASAFPASETPAKTSGYEGFYHLARIEGRAEKAVMEILIRSFEAEEFEARKKFVAGLADDFNRKYGQDTVKLGILDEYYNMRDKIDPRVIKYARAALAAAGVKAKIIPDRGGPDGAASPRKGLPNIFTGVCDSLGPDEPIPLESMEKAVEVIISLNKMLPEFDLGKH